MYTYSKVEGSILARDLTIDIGLGGEEIKVIHLSDLHLHDCTEEDLKNPTLASTWENRVAFREAPRITKNVLDYVDTLKPDQIIIAGDAIDYLSQGSINLMKELVWDRYRNEDGTVNVMAAIGNHEFSQQMTGTVEETLAYEERATMLENAWEHDIYYSSKVIKDKVMIIQMSNCKDCRAFKFFWEGQEEKLKNDLKLAREKGYVVLLTFHTHLNTNYPKYASTLPLTRKMREPFPMRGKAENFFDGILGPSENSPGIDGEIYKIITNSADVIASIFTGHIHGEYYTEIKAKTPDGAEKTIPQYTLCGTTHDNGHLGVITIK